MHRDAVGDARQLFHAMRDVDDADAGRACSRAMMREEALDLAVGERGGRLVHHDDPRVARERFGDFDELLLPDREPRDRHVERQLEPEFGADCARFARSRTAGRSMSTAARRLGAEHDVRRRRQLRHQLELLVDHPDAEPLGRLRRIDARRRCRRSKISPSSARSAPARIFISVDLPAPFSPTSDEHFAGANVERNVGERAHAGKRLPDAAHLEQRRASTSSGDAYV